MPVKLTREKGFGLLTKKLRDQLQRKVYFILYLTTIKMQRSQK
jgi:hypothetical protein